jgi:hypothetical protein
MSIIVFSLIYLAPIDKSNVKLLHNHINYFNSINPNVGSVSYNYQDFNKILIEANTKIPFEDDFIPQGITIVNDYIFIAGYKENSNSICYVIDKNGIVYNTIDLNTTSHVGSIAYDSINELIWMPDEDGLLNAYELTDFFYKSSINYKYQFKDLANEFTSYVDKNKVSISFLTIDNSYIYIGNFSKNDKSMVKKYKINNKNKIKLQFVNSFYLPSKTQGITFIDYNKKKYLISSNSFGRTITSRLNIYEYKNNIEDYTNINNKYIDIPPMSEQIQFDLNKMYVLFESGASKYSDGIDRIEYICILDILSYLKDDKNETNRL